MSVADREFLKQLSLLQSELARYLRTSRQAVCAGIKQEEDYLNSHHLLQLYNALHANKDRRASLIADRLQKRYGLEVDHTSLIPTMSGDPGSFPQGFKEMWVFADELLELTCPTYIHRMLPYFKSPEKTLLYFVSRQGLGDRLAHGIRMATGLYGKDSNKTAQIYILLCNAVMFMPYLMIFDPISKESKGYVKASNGFVQTDPVLTGLLVANFTTAGIRPCGYEGVILANDVGFDGVSFKILHRV